MSLRYGTETIFMILSNSSFIYYPHNDKFKSKCYTAREPAEAGSREQLSNNNSHDTPPPDQLFIDVLLIQMNIPRDPTIGCIFGSDANSCDILLDHNHDKGISKNQFAIQVDTQTQTLIFANLSIYGTKMTRRGRFSTVMDSFRIQFGEDIVVHIGVGNDAQLRFPTHSNGLEDFRIRWIDFNSKLSQHYSSYHRLNSSFEPNMDRQQPDYTLGRSIGGGSHGEVYLGTHRYTAQLYAIKICGHKTVVPRLIWNHEHIVKLESFITYEDFPALVMEYIALGDLRRHMYGLDAIDTAAILLQLLGACCYLHEEGYIHLDVKPSNVLVQSISPVYVKLADMEGVRLVTETNNTIYVTRLYAAPEVLLEEAVDTKVDIWSLGVMALELIGRLPQQRAISRWPMDLRGCYQYLHHSTAHNFISGLLKTRPQERFSAQEALSHGFWQLEETDCEAMRPADLRNTQFPESEENCSLPDTALEDHI